MAERKTLNLNIDEGLTKLTINGDENRYIYVNLSDPGILLRFDEAQKEIEAKMDSYNIEIKADGSAEADTEYATQALRELTEFIEEKVDDIFNYPVSEVVFNGQSCLSTVDGMYFFERFILAILPHIDKAVKEERKAEKKQAEKRAREYAKQAERFKKKI